MIPSPCLPPLASWVNVVITYLLSDFLGLWQAMQFRTSRGATSRMKLTVFPFAALSSAAPAFEDKAAFPFGAAAWGLAPDGNRDGERQKKEDGTRPKSWVVHGHSRQVAKVPGSRCHLAGRIFTARGTAVVG